MDIEEVSRLVGHKVAVRLNSVEARGVEIVATLGEVRDDGVVLLEVGELGPGPTIFCPWDSLKRVRERPPWLRPPHEESEPGMASEGWEYYELREATAEEAHPEQPAERPRVSALALDRVVPIAQRRTVGGITVALTSLELYEGGVGVLRYRLSYDEALFEGDGDFPFMPEPEFSIRDDQGRPLGWSPRGGGGGGGEDSGSIEVEGLPRTGELGVEVTRIAAEAWSAEQGRGPSYEGPWTFQLPI